jgi:hypothetical protein
MIELTNAVDGKKLWIAACRVVMVEEHREYVGVGGHRVVYWQHAGENDVRSVNVTDEGHAIMTDVNRVLKLTNLT